MQKAYEKGNMMAAYQLGKIYADKSKECYDLEKAIDYYKEAAENENALAAVKRPGRENPAGQGFTL